MEISDSAVEVRWAFLFVPDFIHSSFVYEIARGRHGGRTQTRVSQQGRARASSAAEWALWSQVGWQGPEGLLLPRRCSGSSSCPGAALPDAPGWLGRGSVCRGPALPPRSAGSGLAAGAVPGGLPWPEKHGPPLPFSVCLWFKSQTRFRLCFGNYRTFSSVFPLLSASWVASWAASLSDSGFRASDGSCGDEMCAFVSGAVRASGSRCAVESTFTQISLCFWGSDLKPNFGAGL